jgi:hypothetical protein
MIETSTFNITTSTDTVDLETQITEWSVIQTAGIFYSKLFTEKAGRYITVITTDSDMDYYGAINEFQALTRPLSADSNNDQSIQLTVNVE